MQEWDALRRPIWLFDPVNRRGVYANPAALELWEADSLEALQARDFGQLSPAAVARVERLARETADGSVVCDQWTFYPNGHPVTVATVISTYILEDGTPVLLVEASPIAADGDENRATEALRHTSTLISLFDPEGRPIFSNPAAFAAYGTATDGFEARFAEPERAPPLLAAALAGNAVTDVCQVVTRDGLRWHQLDVRPVTDPATGQMSVLLDERDVTARVQAQNARAAAEQKAAMAEARQAFLTEMSHELRTPLNTVIGFSDLLATSSLNVEQADHVGRINNAGQRLLAVVNEMIDQSVRDASEGEAAPAVTGLTVVESEVGAEVSGATCDAIEREASGPTPRILYVDDHDCNRALVVAVLEAQGIACATAEDGAQGLEAARTGDWDLILMDIQMPVMDGVAATRAIRALPGHRGATPIVALTANTLAEQKAEYFAAGMDDCMAKPINIIELTHMVLSWTSSDWRRNGPPLIAAVA
ncbi:MAG: response regulator [Brevundimonas sp.]|uniref:histidine kinase n=1 Tax=Brevundimonas mediterranea TaxID=74329 RepID=A0A7W6F102_9CAUL|nr:MULTISPECIES: response regulator [Brevundimonas]MBB3873475.1 CheY-like chemotaxis protein [Brevundimonas mediterranea]MDK2747024.1 response regulator [Brevundimonas sp.]